MKMKNKIQQFIDSPRFEKFRSRFQKKFHTSEFDRHAQLYGCQCYMRDSDISIIGVNTWEQWKLCFFEWFNYTGYFAIWEGELISESEQKYFWV